MAFNDAWADWQNIDALILEREKVEEEWADSSKQLKDEKAAELKRIDSAIGGLAQTPAPEVADTPPVVAEGAPAQAATATDQTAAPAQTAAPVVDDASDGPKPRRTWRDVALPYMLEVFKSGQYPTAKAFFRALESKAGTDSPFDRGTGANRDSLFVREISEKLALKTVQNAWGEITQSR